VVFVGAGFLSGMVKQSANLKIDAAGFAGFVNVWAFYATIADLKIKLVHKFRVFFIRFISM